MMLSSFSRSTAVRLQLLSASRRLFHSRAPQRLAFQPPQQKNVAPMMAFRFLSTTTDNAQQQMMKVEPPKEITRDMAEGIQKTTLFYLRNGISQQRLQQLAEDTSSPLVQKWQRMMEIYLSTQVYVISGLGFSGDEKGLEVYTRQLATYMQDQCDEELRNHYREVGNETWRHLLCTGFQLDANNIQEISIVDARNIMHKVSSKMQEPSILMKIHKECSKVDAGPELEKEMTMKHQILQSIIVNDVYLGGSPSIPEECGFGTGEKGYAHLQCVMAQYEGDPLIAQYAQAAMARIMEAAGLDLSKFGSTAGSIRLPGT